VLLLLVAVAASAARAGTPGGSALQAILDRSGPNMPMVAGDSDFSVGAIRLSFLIIRPDRSLADRPTARVWIGTNIDAKAFISVVAHAEPVGVRGRSFGYPGVPRLYVARFTIRKPGTYAAVAAPVGGKPVQAFENIVVKRASLSPSVGSKAFPSDTPTLQSTHGDVSKLTTRVPPDRALLQYSVGDSLAAHKPFVLVFATPAFCQSRTCGPVVDVVDAVRRRFARTDIRFIHVEIYKNNDPSQGPNRWVKEWRLPNEPWTFLVGRDGRIKTKFEGAVSVDELARAVQHYLVRAR
jgi:hypothetical protein